MSRHVTVRMTIEQALAAGNACDLIAESYRADGNKRDAGIYERAYTAIDRAINARHAGAK